MSLFKANGAKCLDGVHVYLEVLSVAIENEGHAEQVVHTAVIFIFEVLGN